jgi:rhamnogalacturonan endolyase
VDNGLTVNLKNGIVDATITKANGEITTLMYNGADVLAGGHNGGKMYWSWNMPNYQNPTGCTYTLTTNPGSNGATLAEIKLRMTWNGSATTAAMDVDIYYSIKRNVSGIYAAAKLSHPASYPYNPGGEWRMASYPGSTYNWMSVDNARNMLMPSAADMAAAQPVPGAPQEVVRLTTGAFANRYECKYDYSADYGDIDVWGWSSTTNKTGVWMTAPSKEYYPGGPMKRELMCHVDPVMLNMFGGTHYAMGTDGDIAAGETWSKIYGPFLIYCNKVPAATSNAHNVLWNDAQVQTKAEQAQWPYSWFTEASYVKSSGRGTITGKLVITDPTVASPSAANMWIGVAKTPSSTTGVTDFQMWCKNYQFWVKTDASGNFTIPDVIAGTYNMYAFGPGAAGEMEKLNFVTVTGNATTSVGNVTWTPDRVAPTVWAIGIPDRTAKEFKHGNDWWVPGTYPSLDWAQFMDYKDEFPNDITYTVGQSNWATDWNFVQPYNVADSKQTIAPEWKVRFNLSTAPTAGSNSSIYVAVASAYSAPMYVKINGTNITVPTTGVNFPNPSNATIRKGIHGAFGDLRFTFPSSLLQAGMNEISFTQRKLGGDIQYDYLRLEAPGTTTIAPIAASNTGSLTLGGSLNSSNGESTNTVLYPNPVSSSLYVQFHSKNDATVRCMVMNTLGTVVKTFEVDVLEGKNLLTTDVSNLAAGTYFIKINTKSLLRFIKL